MDRLARLIGDLLDLSRIESGVMLWRDQDVDLVDVVTSAINAVLPLAQMKDIRIEDIAETGTYIIRADRDRIMQVVMNLLSNALKFTPAKGRITVMLGPAVRFPGVAVSIADKGPGIPVEEMGQIFLKFHRSVDVLKNAVEGTGLGLAISRQIVEQIGRASCRER